MRRAVPIAVSCLCAAALLGEAYLARRNTLHRNGAWVSSKVGLARGVMGAVAFLTTRPPLHKNRLDLGAYFGFQEVVHREAVELDEVGFDLQLADGAVLHFLYGCDARGCDALRLSRARELPTAWLRVAPDGGFAARKPFGASALDGGWHRLRARFLPSKMELTIDGAPLGSLPPIPPGPLRFGFRGGFAAALVDEVAVTTRSGARITDTFRNGRGRLATTALALALILSFHGLAFLVVRPKSAGRATARVIAINCTVMALAGTFYAFDYHRLAALYPPVEEIDWAGFQNGIESEADVVARLDARYPRAAPEGVTRILFVGTSQTWGAGATRMEEVFAARIEERLNRERGGKFEVINSGISGSTSTYLRRLYESDWIRFNPRVVVINLGTNDADQIAYRENLRWFAAFNRARGIRTLFVLEANAPEQGGMQQHAVMREVAREESVPLVDLHGWLEARRDSGFVFWDFVHLSSFGQRLAADALYPAVVELLP